MKVKQGKTVPIPECDREGWQVMAARTQDLLVLDCFVDKEYKGRYLMNIETKEYGMLRDGVYSAEKLVRAFSESCGTNTEITERSDAPWRTENSSSQRWG